MSILTFHPAPLARRAAPASKPAAIVRGAVKAALREFKVWRATRSVETLSDASIRDIGITRAEIDHAVRYGRPYRP